MAGGRRLKPLLTKPWYKSSRGGQRVTPGKDLPWYWKEKEVEGKSMYEDKVKEGKKEVNNGEMKEDK